VNTLSEIFVVDQGDTVNLYIDQGRYKPNLRKNQVRSFVNYFRQKFRTIPCEFREIKSVVGWYNSYFIVYGLPKKDFMLIKLAWSFKQNDIELLFATGSKPSGACVAKYSKPVRYKALKITGPTS
jgi:hypothetical protein